ncbi:mitochondrial large subunit ribosomal protein-domain-containing protein [Chaetomium fimeti]|uniref:Large ribosomal subunit protein mL49 n=1 Tax=Chaetomium fimeti TaxID=1854472 RepID=A0AAE0HMY6_9PEZI|nr:mitochondrial large subunit ribosomal protein-domain-containing protein [Chaetomium fimeti]
MLRSATLLRAFAAPSRLALPKAASPSIALAARNYSTPSQSPSPELTGTTSTPQPPTPPKSALTAEPPLTYSVGRTPSGHLSVYQLSKRGGNKSLTVIKNIEGDRAPLRAGLVELLGMEEKKVVVNNLTGHITVKGHHKSVITKWLETQGL